MGKIVWNLIETTIENIGHIRTHATTAIIPPCMISLHPFCSYFTNARGRKVTVILMQMHHQSKRFIAVVNFVVGLNIWNSLDP